MKPRAALLLLLPAMALWVLSFAWPIVSVVRLSLFKSDYVFETFVGLKNYLMAFKDPFYVRSYFNVLVYVAFVVPSTLGISYWVAMYLEGFSHRVQAVGRFVVYLPALTSGYIMGLLWKWFLYRDGLINYVLSFFGTPEIAWLYQPWAARAALSAIEILTSIGILVILFAASLRSIPLQLRDAAVTDGATERQYRRYIVRPLMMPTVLLATLLLIIGVMKIWSTIYILTPGGGPGGATSTPVYEVFLTAFEYGKPGLAAAKGIVLMTLIALAILLKQRIELWVKP